MRVVNGDVCAANSGKRYISLCYACTIGIHINDDKPHGGFGLGINV